MCGQKGGLDWDKDSKDKAFFYKEPLFYRAFGPFFAGVTR